MSPSILFLYRYSRLDWPVVELLCLGLIVFCTAVIMHLVGDGS